MAPLPSATKAAFNAEPEVKSPCVSVCVLDEADVCVGCGRTREEITVWSSAGADTQRSIVAAAKVRMAEMPKP